MSITDEMVERAAKALATAYDDRYGAFMGLTAAKDMARAALTAALCDVAPYHYYFATFTDEDVSTTVDTEPRYHRRYTILRGPYMTAIDAWGDGLDDTDWDAVCVMRWMGASHIDTCYAPFTDDFGDFMPSEIDHDALPEAIRAAVANAKTEARP